MFNVQKIKGLLAYRGTGSTVEILQTENLTVCFLSFRLKHYIYDLLYDIF